MFNLLRNSGLLMRNEVNLINNQLGALFHTSSTLNGNMGNPNKAGKPTRFLRQNRKIFEPQLPDEEPRHAVSSD
jgi:hypothetical protein